MTDLIELQKFLIGLRPSDTVKLHLYVDFTSWRFWFLDLTQLTESMIHIKSRITGFSMQVSSRIDIRGKLI